MGLVSWSAGRGREDVQYAVVQFDVRHIEGVANRVRPWFDTLCKAITNRDWKVTRLILSSSRISDEGLKKLRSALTQSELYSLTLISPKSKSVTNLNVNCNRLGEEGIILLFTFLTSSNCSLISLNVSHYRLGDRVLKDLPEALTNENCTLTSSDIKDNELGDKEIKYLCKALTDSNCKLQSLNLRGNRNITDVEVKGWYFAVPLSQRHKARIGSYCYLSHVN